MFDSVCFGAHNSGHLQQMFYYVSLQCILILMTIALSKLLVVPVRRGEFRHGFLLLRVHGRFFRLQNTSSETYAAILAIKHPLVVQRKRTARGMHERQIPRLCKHALRGDARQVGRVELCRQQYLVSQRLFLYGYVQKHVLWLGIIEWSVEKGIVAGLGVTIKCGIPAAAAVDV